MRLSCLFGSPTLSRETKMLRFSRASQVRIAHVNLGGLYVFQQACIPLNSITIHRLLTHE